MSRGLFHKTMNVLKIQLRLVTKLTVSSKLFILNKLSCLTYALLETNGAFLLPIEWIFKN